MVDFDGLGNIRYNITGASGEDIGTWVEFFRSLAERESVAIRENEILVLLQNVIESTRYQATTSIKVFLPPVASNNLIISNLFLVGGDAQVSEVLTDD